MKTLLVAVLGCAMCLGAGAMTRDQYQAQRARIQDKYATDKDRCATAMGHSRDVCEVQARVDYDIARLALRAQYKPSAANVQKARRARVDGAYDLARAKCGDLAGSAHKVCEDDARSTWATARSEPAL